MTFKAHCFALGRAAHHFERERQVRQNAIAERGKTALQRREKIFALAAVEELRLEVLVKKTKRVKNRKKFKTEENKESSQTHCLGA